MSDYKICGASQIGQSHINSNTLCQDSSYFREVNGYVVAAVADGLGSSKHSDKASNMAVHGVIDYCVERLGNSQVDIKRIMRNAFDEVAFRIKYEAQGALNDFDTTLTLAVLHNETLYYGHAGDSAIIALRENGLFDLVTQPQQGEGVGKDKPVYPLAATDKWVFDTYPHKVKALFLVTDGVLNKVQHPILQFQEYQLDNKYLMYLFSSVNRISGEELKPWIIKEISSISPNECNHDDKSLMVIVSLKAPFRKQPKAYYEFPSDTLWASLQKEYESSLYPYRSDNTSHITGTESKGPRQNHFNRKHLILTAILLTSTILLFVTFSLNSKKKQEERQARFEDSLQVMGKEVIYDGKPHGFDIIIKDEEFSGYQIHFVGRDKKLYTIIPQVTNVNETPLKVEYIVSHKGMKDFSDIAEITIVPFDLANASITPIESHPYTGSSIMPEFSVWAGDFKLVEGYDYSSSFDKNVYPGEATIVLDSRNKNFKGQQQVHFEIEKANLSFSMPDIYYNISDSNFSLPYQVNTTGITGEIIEGTFRWFSDNEYTVETDGSSLLNNANQVMELFWILAPDSPNDAIYNELIGKTRFIAQEKNKTLREFIITIVKQFLPKVP